jgi:hypothetical protein
MAGGQQSDFGQGSFGNNNNSVRLRSKKSGGGSASAELSGQQVSVSAGTLGRSRTKALTGSASTFSGGTVIPSGGGAVGDGRIVDEIFGNDTDLRNHPDILWYPRYDSKPNIEADWSFLSNNFPDYGTFSSTIISWDDFGIPAIRLKSQRPDDMIAGDVGTSIRNWRKGVNSGDTSFTWQNCIGSTAEPELYYRQCFMLEDVAGFTNPGAKFSGFDWSNGVTMNWQHYSPYWDPALGLQTYFFRDTAIPPTWNPRDFFATGEALVSRPILKVGVIYSLESHLKLNSRNANNTFNSDGRMRAWLSSSDGEFDDVLLFDKQNLLLHQELTPIQINHIHGQTHAGGNDGPPSDYIYYQVAGDAVARRRIGPLKGMGGTTLPLPSWRQAMSVNTRINLATNTQLSVQPANQPTINPWYDGSGNSPWRGTSPYSGPGYTTAVYAPELGTHGSLLWCSGGHGAYFGNEVHRLDLGSQLFSCMSDPYTSSSHPGSFFQDPSQGDQHADNVNGELFIDSSFNTDQTQPGAFQGYSTNVVIPASAGVTGVGASGALITPIRSARTPQGNPSVAAAPTSRVHIFDLAQTNRATAAWARFSTNVGSQFYTDRPPAYALHTGWAAFDPTRKKVFVAADLSGGHNKLRVLNCSGATAFWDTAITLSSGVWSSQHGNAFHWLANPDYLILYKSSSTDPAFALINVATGVVTDPGQTGTGPLLVGGSTWVESEAKLVMYEGGGTTDGHEAGPGFPNRVWILTPPSTSNSAVFTTTPWTWTFETVTGPTPPVQGDNIPHAGRFVWCEKVRAFIWWADGDSNAQAWVVNGFE